MSFVNQLLKSVTAKTPTSEYSIAVASVLDKFYEEYIDGEQLLIEIQSLMERDDLPNKEEYQEWINRYQVWQSRTAERNDLKRELAAYRPMNRSLRKIHHDIYMVMRNVFHEQRHSMDVFVKIQGNDEAGAHRARDAAARSASEKASDAAYLRKQLAALRSEDPDVFEAMDFPDWLWKF